MARRRRQDDATTEAHAGTAEAFATVNLAGSGIKVVSGSGHAVAAAATAAGSAVVAGTAVPYAVTSDAMTMGSAVPLTELRRGAMEYNLGRTGGKSFQLPTPFHGDLEPVLVIPDPDAPLAPNTLRAVSVLQGAWLANGSPDCQPYVGVHADRCPHAANVTPFTRRSLAMATFGHGGGSQLAQVTDALTEAAQNTTEIFIAGEGGRWFRQVSHVLSLREIGQTPQYALPGDLPADATGYVSWDPFLHRSLMAGHFQVIPMDLVRDLSGSDFMVWLAVLTRRATAELLRHGHVGETREYSVTGRDATLSVTRMGLGRKRADKLRAALVRAAENGNPLVRDTLGLELWVDDRTGRHPGVKLTLTKLATTQLDAGKTPTAELDDPRQNRTEATAGMARSHGRTGRKPRQEWTPTERDSVGGDRLETGLETGLETATTTNPSREPTEADDVGTMDDLATLLRQVQGWKTVTAKVRRELWDWSQLFVTDDDPAAGYRQLASWVLAAPEPRKSYGYLTERVRSWRETRKLDAEDLDRRRREAAARTPTEPSRAAETETLRKLREQVAKVPQTQVPEPPADPPMMNVDSDDETPEQRGRRMAIASIRAGLPLDMANALRRRYSLTDDDLA